MSLPFLVIKISEVVMISSFSSYNLSAHSSVSGAVLHKKEMPMEISFPLSDDDGKEYRVVGKNFFVAIVGAKLCNNLHYILFIPDFVLADPIEENIENAVYIQGELHGMLLIWEYGCI